MEKLKFTVTAGDNSTDLGIVGVASSMLGAKRIGRKAVRQTLPNGRGKFTVRDQSGREVLRGENTLRTGNQWVEQ